MEACYWLVGFLRNMSILGSEDYCYSFVELISAMNLFDAGANTMCTRLVNPSYYLIVSGELFNCYF